MGWPLVRPFSGAYLCVVYFFMMSGFVLTHAHSGGNFIKYLLTRLARLWPLHVISTTLMVLVYLYNKRHGGYVSSPDIFMISTYIKNILFLHGVTSYSFQLINEPSWSISIEFWASLLIPLIFTRLSLSIKIIIAAMSFIVLYLKNKSGIPPTFSTAALSMLIGSICYQLTKNNMAITFIREKYSLIFITFCGIICLTGIYALNKSRLDFFLLIAFIPLLFTDFLPEGSYITKILSSSFFSFLGYISFPLYLLHESIIVSGFLSVLPQNYLSLILASSSAILIAFLYARFVDDYLYRYLKQRIASLFK
ncbi:Acyltransferase family [Shimwellia blattae]|nr:Acyltransferase family [Shimwellia blattae]VEC22164.1 Acyltransferase family [Shimwellia blattae]